MPPMSTPLSRALRGGLVHLGLAVLVTATVWPRATTRLLGHPDVDVWNHAWGPWWWWTSLSQGQLPWRTELLHFPTGGTLWFIDPVLAGLGAPLVGLLGPTLAFNLVLLAYVAFASWAGGRLGQALGARGGARFVASAAFACSAWIVCELHNGITEAAGIGPVALALAWGEEATRSRQEGLGLKPSLLRWARAGLGVGLAALASPYLGLGTGLWLLVRGLPAIREAWLGCMVAVVVAAPPILVLRAQLESADAIVKHPDEMNEQLALHNAVDMRTFVAPFGFRSRDLSAEGFEHSMYLGLAALCLAAMGLLVVWRRRRLDAIAWALATLTVLVFSLGPYLYVGDAWLEVAGGERIRLPWWAMQKLASGLAVTHPLRLAVPALAAVAGLAALGAHHLEARLRPGTARRALPLALAMLVALDGLVISGAPWPVATADAIPPGVLTSLPDSSDEEPIRAVLDLPTDAGATMATSRYLWWQTFHGRPIPYGPDARANTSALISNPTFRKLAEHSTRRATQRGRRGFADGGRGARNTASLAHKGFGWVVLHPDLDPASAAKVQAEIEADLGPGEVVDGAQRWSLEVGLSEPERRRLRRPPPARP